MRALRPHTPERPNDRVRDVVDLLTLETAFYDSDTTLESLGQACRDLFDARQQEATKAGASERREWPPLVVAHPHWYADYEAYAEEVGLETPLDEAVAMLNDWITNIG